MTVSGPEDRARIFISYRREDAAYPAGWLFDRLADHFGQDRVFKDVDSIELGDDFVDVVNDAVGSCAVLLAVIGPRWLAVTDEDGRRRLDNPEDFVRLEIEAALERGVRVIPVLVEGARMPRSDHLPESLRGFARRQALELAHNRFNADCGRLIQVLDKTLAGLPAAPAQGNRTPKVHNAEAKPDRQVPMKLLNKLRPYDLGLGMSDLGPLAGLLRTPKTGVSTRQIAFSPDGRMLASADSDKAVRIWEVGVNRIIRLLPGHGGAHSVAFSPDGALLAAGGDDGKVRLWSVAKWSEERTLVNPHTTVHAVAFSPDGALLADAGASHVMLWDMATGASTGRPTGSVEGKHIYSVAFSPDGLLLACAGSTGAVQLFDVPTGIQMRCLPSRRNAVHSVAFSPDGRLLACSPSRAAVCLWDLATDAEFCALHGHTGTMHSVAFSPDGILLAAAGTEKTVRLWEVATGSQVGMLSGHNDRISSVAFSPDGRLLASADNGGTILLWG